MIDNVPYHFEKYIPTKEELIRFKKNEGDALFSKGGFFYPVRSRLFTGEEKILFDESWLMPDMSLLESLLTG